MTVVDLTKARAYAESISNDPDSMTLQAADWINSLADEVESLEKLLAATRATSQTALAEGAELAAENAQLRAALTDICTRVALMLRGVRT